MGGILWVPDTKVIYDNQPDIEVAYDNQPRESWSTSGVVEKY